MQLSELKLVTASNIIKLRTDAGMTQAELGARLCYSDKSVSKWERGEAVPDAYVLTQLAEIFSVTVDFLLSSHDDWEAPKKKHRKELTGYSANIIVALVILSIWTTVLSVFVVLWLYDIIWWRIFIIAIPVSFAALIVLVCVFKLTDNLQHVIAAFVLSIFLLLYFMLPNPNPWQLFLIAAPAVGIVYLSCNIKSRIGHKDNNKQNFSD